jgi:hypothetical protein
MPMTDKPKSHSNQGHADPDKAGREQYKRHIDGDLTVRGQIETHFPPNLIEQHKTERKEDKGREKKKFIVEVLTLAAVVIYAGITFWQACLTKRGIENNAAQFWAENRPWLTFRAESPPDEKARVVVGFTNTGKTPATHATDVDARTRVIYGNEVAAMPHPLCRVLHMCIN